MITTTDFFFLSLKRHIIKNIIIPVFLLVSSTVKTLKAALNKGNIVSNYLQLSANSVIHMQRTGAGDQQTLGLF